MIHLLISDRDTFKFNDESGEAWLLKDDKDENPIWVKIKNQEEKEK